VPINKAKWWSLNLVHKLDDYDMMIAGHHGDYSSHEMKKRSEEMQTLHASCSRIFALQQTPFPEEWDGQN